MYFIHKNGDFPACHVSLPEGNSSLLPRFLTRSMFERKVYTGFDGRKKTNAKKKPNERCHVRYFSPTKESTLEVESVVLVILLMAEILHQLIGTLSHYLQGLFTSQVGFLAGFQNHQPYLRSWFFPWTPWFTDRHPSPWAQAFDPKVEKRALLALRQLCEEVLQRCPEDLRKKDAKMMTDPAFETLTYKEMEKGHREVGQNWHPF